MNQRKRRNTTEGQPKRRRVRQQYSTADENEGKHSPFVFKKLIFLYVGCFSYFT